jgi:hypothetical protein
MLPSLRSSLPFTLALAIITYLVFSFVLSSLTLDTPTAVTLGVVLAGVLVPMLVELKPLESTGTTAAPKAVTVTASVPTIRRSNKRSVDERSPDWSPPWFWFC